jgi:hypothetical protein
MKGLENHIFSVNPIHVIMLHFCLIGQNAKFLNFWPRFEATRPKIPFSPSNTDSDVAIVKTNRSQNS